MNDVEKIRDDLLLSPDEKNHFNDAPWDWNHCGAVGDECRS